jgi:phytoene dehydrogenase-like protein
VAHSAVVVGSGPNGLAAAVVLARAGLEVVVHEAEERWGGGTRTEELTLPGFRHDVCSAIHPLARWSACFGCFELGVEWLESPACVAHPLEDEEAVLAWRDLDATAAGLGRDARAYRSLVGPLVPAVARPWLLVRSVALGLATADHVARRFETRPARALLAGCAAHSMLPLERRPSAGFGLALLALAHAVGWPFPRGGSQSIADALVARLREAGGDVVTSSPVDELPRADLVLCDVSPRELLRLARMEDRPLRRFRQGPGAFKLDWALSGPIPWRDPRCAQAATVHLGGTYEEIAASERAPGTVPPFVLLAQPSLWDSTRAPGGRQTAWAYCHVPNGSPVDFTEAVEAQVERFAPGFRGRILARSARGPRELEAHNRNLVGGDINGGLMDLRQLWTRPAPRLVPWRTPLRGVYLCSASTPPGGGVHGLCGWAAARLALRDLRRGRV